MPRKTLSREAVVTAAFDLLAEGGLGAITARALAGKLGVQPGALYYHVKDMNTLVDEMATRIMLDLTGTPADPGASWDDQLRTSAIQLRAGLLRYRDGAKLFAGTHLTDDESIGSMEQPLTALTAAGFGLREALWAWQSFYNYVIGYVIEEQERFRPDATVDERYRPEARQPRIDVARFPLTHAAGAYFATDADEQFIFGVQTLILGLRAQLADNQAST